MDPAPGFKYKYSLFVDGKPLEQFKQRQAKSLRIWEAMISEKDYRVVLGIESLSTTKKNSFNLMNISKFYFFY